MHHLPTFQILGVQLGVSESTVNYIFHRHQKYLENFCPLFN
ncbi:transposase family protein [Microcoleus sp. herbarium2]